MDKYFSQISFAVVIRVAGNRRERILPVAVPETIVSFKLDTGSSD